MFDDENLRLYVYALTITSVIVGASFFAQAPQVQVAALRVDAIELGAIETASIPRSSAPEDAVAWNYPSIPWQDYEGGMREMAQRQKPGVLVLHADWCLVCKDYQRLFADASVAQYADDYVFMLVDIEKDPTLQRRFDIDGDYIPRTFVLSPDGGLRRGATGDHERQRFFVDPYRPEGLASLLDEAR